MSASVQIALFLPSLAGGGAQRVMLDLADQLSARGNRIAIIVGTDAGAYRSRVPESAELVVLGVRRMAFAPRRLARWIRENRPDALLATLAHANIIASLAAHMAGIPVRIVLREANTPSWSARRSAKEAFVTRLARFAYRRADAVIAGSKGVADELALAGVAAERLHVLANPIDTEAIRSEATIDPGHPWFREGVEVPVVLAAGRLSRQKGFDVLLDAFARLRARRLARLIILGEGEGRAVLKQQADALGIHEDVDMPGFVDNPYAYMSRAALFVLSSRWEGLPNVLLQALACGCPCVSTDCPNGPAEILESGRYGDLVPVDDVEALVGAMERTLCSGVDRERLQARAWCYDARTLIDEWRAVILGVDPYPDNGR